MAKIRALHPDFFTDDAVVECSPLARLLFEGLWCYACDNGHVEDRPTQLKLRILPADDCDIEALLAELIAKGKVVREPDGWLTVRNLTKRQRPDKRYYLTCDHAGCERPPLRTRREALPEPGELPPDPQGDHTVAPLWPPCGNNVATTDARSGHSTDGDGDGDGDNSLVPDSADAEPDDEEQRDDIRALCEHLASAIESNGSKRPTITREWRKQARLLTDKDRRPVDEAHRLIDWCQRDTFWRSNILSMPTFRKQYDKLRLKSGGGVVRTSAGTIDVVGKSGTVYEQDVWE